MGDHGSRRVGGERTPTNGGRDGAWYEALLEAASDLVVVLDEIGRIQYVSPSVRRVLGYAPEDLVGRSAFEFVHPDDREEVVEEFFQYAETSRGRSAVVEYRAPTADGGTRVMEAVGRDRFDTAPIDGFVISARDVTERKRREQELAEYETILETAPVGLFTLDEDAVVTWANDVFAETLGLPQEAFVGESFLDLIERGYYDESVTERYLDHVRRLLSSKVDVDQANFTVETNLPDGETLVHDVYTTLLPLDDGEFRGTVTAFRDITTQKKYERELERQNARLDAFTSVVSHDLRNPLNVAQGHLEFGVETGDPEALETVRRAHDRMETLIEDLLTLAREGDGVTEPEPVDVATVAGRAWASVDTGDAALAVADDTGTVLADPQRLQQAFENLFRNSAEHGVQRDPPDDDPATDGLTVTVGPLDDGRGFFVADDGPGVPETVRERVFERGFSTEPDGTGFGLAIVATIAEAHGWSVAAVEAEGARFEVRDVETAGD